MRNKKKIALSVIIALLAMGWHVRGSVIPQKDAGSGAAQTEERSKKGGFSLSDIADAISGADEDQEAQKKQDVSGGGIAVPGHEDVTIPSYKGKASAEVNGNRPFIADSDLSRKTFIRLSDKDSLGRPQAAYACLSRETMPETKRESIGMVKPAGWHTYNMPELKRLGSDSNYLYNRCHLIGFQLSGLNADNRNLITGTRQLNTSNDVEGDGMLKWENATADYMRRTGNRVMYRVTPVYQGNSLLCDGVLMEARSVGDSGLSFCVFVYNEQHGVSISHATGEAKLNGGSLADTYILPSKNAFSCYGRI